MRLTNFWTGLVPVLVTTVLTASGCVNPTPTPDPQPVPKPKPAQLTLSGSPVYGGVTIGQAQEATFTVTNTGAGDATLDQSVITNFGVAGPYTITGGTCPTTAVVQANSKNNCTLIIKFTPVAEAHAFQDVTMNYTDPTMDASQDVAVPFKFTLDGFGILDCINFPQPQCPKPAAVLSISDGPTFDYTTVTVGTTADHTFTVTNTGRAAATLGDMTATGLGLTGPFTVTSETCSTGGTVSALTGSCTITVHFAPTDVPLATASLDVAYSSPAGSADATRAVKGTGVLDCKNHRVAQCPPQAPSLSISDATTFDFTSIAIGNAGTHSFTVTNTGDADATLAAVTTASLGLSAPYSLIDGSCVTTPVVAAGGGSCTINVQFAPTAAGQINETIDVKYTGATITGTVDLTRAIRGTGFLDCDNYPQPSCPPPMPNFQFTDISANSYGNVAIGTTSDLTFTITNLGRAVGTMGSITDSALGLSGALSISGGTCGGGSVLAAQGGSCTLTIRFTPGDTSATTETFTIAYAGAGGFGTPLTRQIFGSGILNCLAANDLFTAYLSGVSTAQTQNQTEAGQGTADGTAISTTNGYNDGYAATYQTAYNSAYNQAYNNAYNASYASGYTTGANDAQSCVDGSNAGTAAGTTDGTSKGYGDGVSKGSVDGYNAGSSAGYNDGLPLGETAGNDAGVTNGDSQGYTDGYNSAYSNGQANGNTAGYSVGFTDGANACPAPASATGPLLARVVQLRAASVTTRQAVFASKIHSNLRTLKQMLGSVSSTADYVGQCTQQGYAATYDSNSYQTAYNAAAHSGAVYQASYANGVAVATSDADSAGGAKGITDGDALGASDGLAAGKLVQYNGCYASAYSAGYTTGYNDQYTTIYNSTFATYYTSGYADGHNSGYNSGFNNTYGNAFVTAYNSSYATGATAGDTDGYNAGYSSGYATGYAAGQASCPAPAASSKGTILAMRTQLLTSDATPKLYGGGQKWARTASNGAVVSVHVSRPIRHGVRIDSKVMLNARLKARQLLSPRLQAALLK